ncbi:MAG: ACGX-repeat peptide [Clostridiaceae bacterium]
MAKLNMLNAWSGNSNFFSKRSAQGYLNSGKVSYVSGSCGSACGAGDDKPDSKPSSCGSACGAGDK